MRLVLWANGQRGAACLQALLQAERRPSLVVLHARDGADRPGPAEIAARAAGLSTFAPADPNAPDALARIAAEAAELFVLAGYGRILRPAALKLARRGAINLHAGKLPEYRGSSPMNWALIHGETSFTLSVIEVEAGVDTGPVLAECTLPIEPNATICDLHALANARFPALLNDVLDCLEVGQLRKRPQDPRRARYFPLRFPDDGLVLWDQLSAAQVHNRVRALRPPFPGAFTFHGRRRVNLIASALCGADVRGEPGRVYRKSTAGLLVCAADRCLLIREAVYADDGSPLHAGIERYERLATMQAAALRMYTEGLVAC